jgi:hypothetical protein
MVGIEVVVGFHTDEIADGDIGDHLGNAGPARA